MPQRKIIYWRKDFEKKDGKSFANVHVITNQREVSLAELQAMADKLRETFPEATNDMISVGQVRNSDTMSGYPLIAYNAYIAEGTYQGWEQPKGKCLYAF